MSIPTEEADVNDTPLQNANYYVQIAIQIAVGMSDIHYPSEEADVIDLTLQHADFVQMSIPTCREIPHPSNTRKTTHRCPYRPLEERSLTLPTQGKPRTGVHTHLSRSLTISNKENHAQVSIPT